MPALGQKEGQRLCKTRHTQWSHQGPAWGRAAVDLQVTLPGALINVASAGGGEAPGLRQQEEASQRGRGSKAFRGPGSLENLSVWTFSSQMATRSPQLLSDSYKASSLGCR